jgi:hypothetical protein
MGSMNFEIFKNMTSMNNGEVTAVCNELAAYMGANDRIDIFIAKDKSIIITYYGPTKDDIMMAYKGLHEVDWKYTDLTFKKQWKKPELKELKVNDIVDLSIK